MLRYIFGTWTNVILEQQSVLTHCAGSSLISTVDFYNHKNIIWYFKSFVLNSDKQPFHFEFKTT